VKSKLIARNNILFFPQASLTRAIGDAQIVMMGEATHGTEEFYKIRAELTQELVRNVCRSTSPRFCFARRCSSKI
jgi:hypothetical protein